MLLRRHACAISEHIRLPSLSLRSARLVGRIPGLRLPPLVEVRPNVVPVARRGGLRILGRAGLEEVGVLDPVEQRGEPRQGVVLDHVHRLEAELAEPPVGDV
jgi:hypothetical protein